MLRSQGAHEALIGGYTNATKCAKNSGYFQRRTRVVDSFPDGQSALRRYIAGIDFVGDVLATT
jgi:hypothetical protein